MNRKKIWVRHQEMKHTAYPGNDFKYYAHAFMNRNSNVPEWREKFTKRTKNWYANIYASKQKNEQI